MYKYFLFISFILIQANSVCSEETYRAVERIISADRSDWEIEYFLENKNIGTRRHYSDGTMRYQGEVLNGKVCAFYPEGILMKDLKYKEGLREGKCFNYWKNGKIFRETQYHKGTLDGIVKEYYQDGTLKFVENWQGGQRHGTQFIYAPSGKMIEKVYWDKGVMYNIINF